MRKLTDADAGNLYAMKVLKKATLKGEHIPLFFFATLVRIFVFNLFYFQFLRKRGFNAARCENSILA